MEPSAADESVAGGSGSLPANGFRHLHAGALRHGRCPVQGVLEVGGRMGGPDAAWRSRGRRLICPLLTLGLPRSQQLIQRIVLVKISTVDSANHFGSVVRDKAAVMP